MKTSAVLNRLSVVFSEEFARKDQFPQKASRTWVAIIGLT